MTVTHSEHDEHYAPGDIAATIASALAAVGRDRASLGVDDLAGIDQFHSDGIESTRSLAQHAAITADDRVLDVGGGLGGPARLLAQEYGCRVTVLDLTEAYCRVGALLTEQAHLADLVDFQQGDALDLPFNDGAFDVVWTQHSSMNIGDKQRLYAEIHRVLRPGGRLALQEVATGSGEALHFPTFWAHSQNTSFLVPSDVLRATLNLAGFRELAWQDTSQWTLDWFREGQQTQQNVSATQTPLGLQLVLGKDAREMLRNHIINLQEGRMRIVEGIVGRI